MNSAAALLKQNTALAALSQEAGPKITKAVYSAAQNTGVDFSYLLQQAKMESSFRPDIKASTSSATGLYQFIDSTWLDMVNRHGEKYGIDTEQSKSALLKLRKDPEISSQMAAEFARENYEYLDANWAKGKKDIGSTELYLAHFMGAGGAAAFLRARDENPLQPAAELFSSAARVNKSIFFEPGTQRARTLEEVYARFDQKFQDAPESIDLPEKSRSIETANGTVPVQTFTQSRNPLFIADQARGPNLQSLFTNNDSARSAKWLKLSSLDFVNLLKTI